MGVKGLRTVALNSLVLLVIVMLFYILLFSSKTEVRFPINIGITGHVATTGEV